MAQQFAEGDTLSVFWRQADIFISVRISISHAD